MSNQEVGDFQSIIEEHGGRMAFMTTPDTPPGKLSVIGLCAYITAGSDMLSFSIKDGEGLEWKVLITKENLKWILNNPQVIQEEGI